MAVITTAAVGMTMTTVLKDKYANKVNDEAQNGDDKQPLMLDFRRLHQPLHRLTKYEERDEQQEQSVHESGQDFCPHITVRISVIRSPFSDDRRCQASQEARAVEKHVEGVRNQAQGIGSDPIKQFHEGETQIKDQKTQQVSRVFVA